MTHMELVAAITQVVGFVQQIVQQIFSVIVHGTNEEIGRLLLALLTVYVLLLLLGRLMRSIWSTVVFTLKLAVLCIAGIFVYTAVNYGLEPALNMIKQPVLAFPLGIDYDFVLQRLLYNAQ